MGDGVFFPLVVSLAAQESREDESSFIIGVREAASDVSALPARMSELEQENRQLRRELEEMKVRPIDISKQLFVEEVS